MAVRVYQVFFSALMPSACKFYPSCSRYAAEALLVHGARRGTWLAMRRLGRCHPFTKGGVDFVPDRPDVPAKEDNGPADAAGTQHAMDGEPALTRTASSRDPMAREAHS
jgi:hypothetical protein